MHATANKTFVSILLLVLVSALHPVPSRAAPLALQEPDALAELKKTQGCALIGIDNGGTQSSIALRRLNKDGTLPRKRGGTSYDSLEYTVKLGDHERNFYCLVLTEGQYQITQLSYPYFDLPFRLDTRTDKRWRFRVEAGKTNYIGQLVVARERSKERVDVNLLNRIATDIEAIRAQYSALLLSFPLTQGLTERDDFLTFVEQP